MMRNRADALSLWIFLQRGWVVKSLANKQLSTGETSHAQKISGKFNRGCTLHSYAQAVDFS
jgi:hypothetical protein